MQTHTQIVVSLIVFGCIIVLCMKQMMAKKNKIRSGGCDYESAGGFYSSPFVLFFLISAYIVMSATKKMTGDGRQRTEEQNRQNIAATTPTNYI